MQHISALLVNFRGVTLNNHVVGSRLAAGGNETSPALYFDLTQAACTCRQLDIPQGAQVGDVYAIVERCFQDSLTPGRLDLDTIYGQRDNVAFWFSYCSCFHGHYTSFILRLQLPVQVLWALLQFRH